MAVARKHHRPSKTTVAEDALGGESGHLIDIGDNDASACARDSKPERPTDPAACAGDECKPSVQKGRHSGRRLMRSPNRKPLIAARNFKQRAGDVRGRVR